VAQPTLSSVCHVPGPKPSAMRSNPALRTRFDESCAAHWGRHAGLSQKLPSAQSVLLEHDCLHAVPLHTNWPQLVSEPRVVQAPLATQERTPPPGPHWDDPSVHPPAGQVQLALAPLCWQVIGEGHVLPDSHEVHAPFMTHVSTALALHCWLPRAQALEQQTAVLGPVGWQVAPPWHWVSAPQVVQAPLIVQVCRPELGPHF
jgi:hypothetical protein